MSNENDRNPEQQEGISLWNYPEHDAVFRDDGFLPNLELDIITIDSTQHQKRPEYHYCIQVCWHWIITCLCQSKWDLGKLIPTFLVSNAFSCSITVLTGCNLIIRQDIINNSQTTPSTTTNQGSRSSSSALTFGLWSYTANVSTTITAPSHPQQYLDFITNTTTTATIATTTTTMPPMGTVEYHEECQSYNFYSPHAIVVLDAEFRTARAFGIIAACIGFLTMAALWIGIVRDAEFTTTTTSRTVSRCSFWRRWVGCGLLVCCFLEGMTLIVLQSGACHNNNKNNSDTNNSASSQCRLGSGSNWVIVACVQYFVTGILFLQWTSSRARATSNNNKARYTHASLAVDEDDEDTHSYPAEVPEDHEYNNATNNVWSGFWNGLGSEEVELVMPNHPYRDNPPNDMLETNTHGEQQPNHNNSNSISNRPSMSETSSSLRNLLSSFDSELMDTIESSTVIENYGRQQQQRQKGQSTDRQVQHFVEVPPPPRIKESPSQALERLRHQSIIQVLPIQIHHDEHVIHEELELGSRDSLHTILNSFRDESTTISSTTPRNCDTNEPSVNRSNVSHRQQQHVEETPPPVIVSSTPTANTCNNTLKTILDAFDDDEDDKSVV